MADLANASFGRTYTATTSRVWWPVIDRIWSSVQPAGAEGGCQGPAQIAELQVGRETGASPDRGKRVLEVGLLIGATRVL